MPPPTTPCPSCGQAFFTASMKIHFPQCQKKKMQMIIPCPACGCELPQSQLNAHLATCKAALSRMPGRRTLQGPPSKVKGQSDALDLSTVAINPVGPDGRVPCSVCTRRFSPDRIAAHQYICAGLKHGPPGTTRAHQGEDQLGLLSSMRRTRAPCRCGSSTQSGERGIHAGGRGIVVSSRGSKGGGGGKGCGFGQATARDPAQRAAPYWKLQSEEFRNAMRAARGEGPLCGNGRSYNSSGGGGGGGAGSANGELWCKHCGRTFAPNAWERHEPQCKNTINKPKPPPRPAAHSAPRVVQQQTPQASSRRGGRGQAPRSEFGGRSGGGSSASGGFGGGMSRVGERPRGAEVPPRSRPGDS